VPCDVWTDKEGTELRKGKVRVESVRGWCKRGERGKESKPLHQVEGFFATEGSPDRRKKRYLRFSKREGPCRGKGKKATKRPAKDDFGGSRNPAQGKERGKTILHQKRSPPSEEGKKKGREQKGTCGGKNGRAPIAPSLPGEKQGGRRKKVSHSSRQRENDSRGQKRREGGAELHQLVVGGCSSNVVGEGKGLRQGEKTNLFPYRNREPGGKGEKKKEDWKRGGEHRVLGMLGCLRLWKEGKSA